MKAVLVFEFGRAGSTIRDSSGSAAVPEILSAREFGCVQVRLERRTKGQKSKLLINFENSVIPVLSLQAECRLKAPGNLSKLYRAQPERRACYSSALVSDINFGSCPVLAENRWIMMAIFKLFKNGFLAARLSRRSAIRNPRTEVQIVCIVQIVLEFRIGSLGSEPRL